MKKFLVLLAAILSFGMFIGCSNDDDDDNNSANPPAQAANADFVLALPTTWSDTVFTTLDTLNRDGETCTAVRVKQLLMLNFDTILVHVSPGTHDDDTTIFNCFGYVPVGSDGFSCRGELPNIVYAQFGPSYLDIDATPYPDIFYPVDMLGKYRVRGVANINFYRVINVQSDFADTFVQFELAAMETVTHANFSDSTEGAIPLSAFITPYVVADAQSHTYRIEASDGFGPSSPLTYAQLSTGYWLIHTQKTIFEDSTLTGGSYKLRNLAKIYID